ncbi:MAG: polynucleotide adenylyltransferase PcnB [Candidatus Binataceae bacterium]
MTPQILERSEHRISRRDIDSNVLKVLYRLIRAGHIAYIVGGGVRDLMLGRRPKDFDIATSAHPHQVRELFRNSRLIGRRFRLVHVFFGRQNIEVATFRRPSEEIAEENDPIIRHDNTFGTPEEDAFRRDFTVNALFYDVRTFQVIDYIGGLEDLSRRVVKTIGDPEVRMREDPVRMIRAIRMSARFGFSIDPATEAAILRHREDLRKASPARLVEETYRTFGMAGAAAALDLAAQYKLLDILLPPLGVHMLHGTGQGRSRTAVNMAQLERVTGGAVADRVSVLASLFLDFFLEKKAIRAPADIRELVTELRVRGFARIDTERMRFILETFPYMLNPDRRVLKLARRPYFREARDFYHLMAPNYGADPKKLDFYVESPPREKAGEHASFAPGRRRRHRRRRRRKPVKPVNGAAASPQPFEHPASDFAHAGSRAFDPAQSH